MVVDRRKGFRLCEHDAPSTEHGGSELYRSMFVLNWCMDKMHAHVRKFSKDGYCVVTLGDTCKDCVLLLLFLSERCMPSLQGVPEAFEVQFCISALLISCHMADCASDDVCSCNVL